MSDEAKQIQADYEGFITAGLEDGLAAAMAQTASAERIAKLHASKS